MPFTEPSPQGDILTAFLSILFEGAPYILLGTIISGFIDAYLPSGAMDRLLPKNKVGAVMLSGLLGGIFPVCECAVVPVIRRLVQKGLPISCAITYMLSAPIINPIVVLSTASAFKGQDAAFITSSRLLMAYVITVVIGLVVSRFAPASILRPSVMAGIRKAGDAPEKDGAEAGHAEGGSGSGSGSGSAPQAESGEKLTRAMRSALSDFLDTGMYFTIGVMITAVFNTQFDQARLEPLATNDFLAVPALMALAFVLSLCSTSDAFIAATMSSFSYVAKLAFLVFGPMMDVKLIFMYSAVFRRRFVAALVIGVFALVALLCLLWANVAPIPTYGR